MQQQAEPPFTPSRQPKIVSGGSVWSGPNFVLLSGAGKSVACMFGEKEEISVS
jgi:hypothetical protein